MRRHICLDSQVFCKILTKKIASNFANYSPLSASTGSNFAARLAGLNPKIIPTKTEKKNEMKQLVVLTVKLKARTYSNASVIRIPKAIPAMPPITVIAADSIKN